MSISGKGRSAFKPAQARMKASAAIAAFKTPRPGETSVRGRSTLVSGKGMTLGLAHAPDEFLREKAGKIRRPFVRQVRIINTDPRIV